MVIKKKIHILWFLLKKIGQRLITINLEFFLKETTKHGICFFNNHKIGIYKIWDPILVNSPLFLHSENKYYNCDYQVIPEKIYCELSSFEDNIISLGTGGHKQERQLTCGD